jgi:Glycosyltransferase family 87
MVTLRNPHVALAVGVAGMLAAEAGYRWRTSLVWLFLEGAFALAALLLAWRRADELRLAPLLALTLALQAGFVVIHLTLGAVADVDTSQVFRDQGNALLDGDYPRSEYPTGAVLLFGFEALIGGGTTRVPNAFLMIPFQLVLVAAVWSLRTRWSPWLAAVVALWPANAYYWEFKYDLAPAALLAVGLALALRGRWSLAGAALGIGAALKWTPALAFLALAVWLLASGRRRLAGAHALAFAGAFALLTVPFLLWSPGDVVAAYTRQGDRGITAESVWYLLLRPLDLAEVRGHISEPAGAPGWSNVAATLLQVVLVAAVLAAAARVRGNLRAAVALAALAPAVFLLANRIFSPQFLVPILAAWAVAAALVVRSPREQLAVGLTAMAATGANAFVYPYALPFYDQTWPLASATLFALGFALTGWLAVRALRAAPQRAPEHERRGEREDRERVEVVEDHREVEGVRGQRAGQRRGQPPGEGAHAGG